MLAAWALPAGADARSATRVDELEVLVAKLGSPHWREREQASEAILAIGDDSTDERIKARLSRQDLSTEQRHRLVDALCRRIVERPRGAIGITMDTFRRDGRGVHVRDLVRGMPAADVLRVGDLIESINDEPIRDSEDLAGIVQELRPGTAIRLRVQRPVKDGNGRTRRNDAGETIAEPVELTITLGSMDQLEQRERQGGNGVRVQRFVLQDREREAEFLRGRFGAPGSVVPVEGLAQTPSYSTFAGLLDHIESELSLVEKRPMITVADLEAVLRGLETARGRLGDPSVTERDRERLVLSMRRVSELLQRSVEARP